MLVPRTRDTDDAIFELLRRHGASPEQVATIAVEPPRTPAPMERAIKGLVDGRYQWVVFTSVNAVRAIWEKFLEFGLDARAFSGVSIACADEASRDAVRALGIKPDLVAEDTASTAGLLEVFPEYDEILDPVDRILLPRADIATETLADGLRDIGWEIDDVTAYRTVRAAPPPAPVREAIKSGGFDAVLFTSSSTVRNLVGIAGKPHSRSLVGVLGPKTAETAREFGLRVDVQPESRRSVDAGRRPGPARESAAGGRRPAAAATVPEAALTRKHPTMTRSAVRSGRVAGVSAAASSGTGRAARGAWPARRRRRAGGPPRRRAPAWCPRARRRAGSAAAADPAGSAPTAS